PGLAYDAIIDIGGNRPLELLRGRLTSRGRAVLVGGESGGQIIGPLGGPLRALLMSAFGSQKLIPMLASVRTADLETLTELIEAGKLRPVIDRTYTLAETADAMRHLEAGRARGKIVVRVAQDL
ncbi:MAG: zinc-binding dehydrogenase, partial [Candidatus Dormibacteraeota bacterium]|nr:zinc-binding dehydrogenase [Candidatus Dormibacteraeota bacterium]